MAASQLATIIFAYSSTGHAGISKYPYLSPCSYKLPWWYAASQTVAKGTSAGCTVPHLFFPGLMAKAGADTQRLLKTTCI